MPDKDLENAGHGPAEEKRRKKQLFGQALLCLLCCIVGMTYPALLDWSKTAMENEVVFEAGHIAAREKRSYPFSPVSVVLVDLFTSVAIALCYVMKKKELSSLFADSSLVLKMMPLGFIYAIGELLTLRSVQKGSGPVYIVISNMKLVVAAIMSRAVFGASRSMPWLHWLELVLISLAAALYTFAEAGAMGTAWEWEGAWSALAKSALVSFSSVFCEHTYKNNSFVVVLTLQAIWALSFIVLLIGVSCAGIAVPGVALELRDDAGASSIFGSGPRLPLCESAAHAICVQGLPQMAAGSQVVCRCMSKRGWDFYTLGAIFADLSNAVSSALVFKRLSAVAKYVCRATSALPMYLFYCFVGRSSWDFSVFAIILFLCLQVAAYTFQRHTATARSDDSSSPSPGALKAPWVQHYNVQASSEGPDMRQRHGR